jgi:hypothetical protein
MPIKTNCPNCDKVYNLADTMDGKAVKCKECGNTFTVTGSNGIASAPSGGKVKAAAKARRRASEDDGEEAKGGMGKMLLIGGAIFALLFVLFLAGAGVGGYFIYQKYWGSSSESASSSDKDKKDKDADNKDKSNADKSNTDKVNPDKVNTDKVVRDKEEGPPKIVSVQNFQKLQNGMTKGQVETFLGPSSGGILDGEFSGRFIWLDFQNKIEVTYRRGKVNGAEATIDNQTYKLAGDTVQPPPTSKVTLANYNTLRGGMTDTDVQNMLGFAADINGTLDADAANYDKAKVYVYKDGGNSITVTYCDNKVARWSAMIDGQKYGPNKADAFVLLNTKITKANFEQIAGGKTEFELKGILGNPTNMNGQLDAAAQNYDKAKVWVWQNGADSITVTFCNNRAARWSATIGGTNYPAKEDKTFVLVKNNSPVTLANYNAVNKGATQAMVVQVFGQASFTSNPANHKANNVTKEPAHISYHCKWTDGQGGEMTIFFKDYGQGGIVDNKESNNKLK